mmetsp:Transcript_48671/g.155769  ORF Transcript_48671/g.155769 Transcript_48671/m.155769 type:complete len:448 (-) Transcript_48671:135-1478(-)
MTMHAAARLPRAPPPSLRGCRVLRARGGSLLAARGVGRGVPSAASRLMVSCQVVAVTESYEALCDEHCITREVVLRKGGPCGRGVFASRDFSPGDVLLSVDLSQCLVAARGDVPAISTPTATWDELASSGGWRRLGEWAASPYTDEDEHIFFSLALALIDSKHRAPGAGLWGQYSAYLPAPGTLTTPVCLPPPLVAELQDPVMASRTAEQTERLAALCPNGGAHCGPFGGSGWDALVPFVDMTNHSFEAPNAEVQLQLDTNGFTPEDGFLRPTGTFRMVAMAPIPEGKEVLISYTGASDNTNRGFFSCYGLVCSGGNANDKLDLGIESIEGPGLQAGRLDRAVEAAAAGKGRMGQAARERRVAAVRASLPMGDAGGLFGRAKADRAALEAEYNHAREIWDLVAGEMAWHLGVTPAQDRTPRWDADAPRAGALTRQPPRAEGLGFRVR